MKTVFKGVARLSIALAVIAGAPCVARADFASAKAGLSVSVFVEQVDNFSFGGITNPNFPDPTFINPLPGFTKGTITDTGTPSGIILGTGAFLLNLPTIGVLAEGPHQGLSGASMASFDVVVTNNGDSDGRASILGFVHPSLTTLVDGPNASAFASYEFSLQISDSAALPTVHNTIGPATDSDTGKIEYDSSVFVAAHSSRTLTFSGSLGVVARVVPEPSSLALSFGGLACLGARRLHARRIKRS